MTFTPQSSDVLIVVDLQRDFLPGGALAVLDGDAIVEPIESLAGRFEHVILTQDWHPADHISFAASHEGKAPFDTIELDYGPQVLWPDHCVQGTPGAEIVSKPLLVRAELIIRKGYNRGVDSYSGFREADRATRTGLAGYLSERGFERLFIVGLATDFCVSWTALDGAGAGFEAYVLEDLTRPINANGSLDKARADWARTGVEVIGAGEIG